MAAAKYNRPAPNLTPVILLVTAVLAVAAVLVDLPVGVVVWLGVAVTAIAYPAPVMTGTKGVAANEHEERQQEKYRSWLQTRAAMFLGNGVGWRTFMPAAPGNASEAAREIRQVISQARQAGLPAWKLILVGLAGSIAPILRALMPRLAYLPALGLGLIAAALPLSGDVIERAVLAVTELNDAPQAISVPMPWWAHLVSGALLAHTVLVLSARKQALSSEPEVGLVGPGELWADRRGMFWLVVPVAALGVWLGSEGLSALWEGLPGIATALAGAGGGLLALYVLLAKTSRDLGLAQWRKVQAAKSEWEPRFSSALKIKDGDAKAMPRIVDRTEIETENGTVTVDTVDSPAGLLVDGMVKNSPALEASLGGGHSLTVLSSPNVDSKRQPVPGTKHPVRVRLVTWPDGTHPNLLDVNLPEELVRITHECDMTDAMDSIGYARPILLELQQVAVMPEKVAPEDAENEPDDEPETDEADETDETDESAEPAKPARKKGGALKRIGRFLTGAPEPEPVYPASAPCAVWMTTWAFPEGPSYEALRTESDSVAQMASRGSDGVDVVVDHRKGFVLIGDPVADDIEYIPESGLEPEYVRQRLTEKLWERRWETTLQQGANPPTVRFEVTRDAELPARFGGGAVIHEQLFACREGLSATETYIDPAKPLERAMAASLSGAPFVSIVGWPASPRQYGTRHSLLFLVRWSESQVPERPQEVAPAERARGIDTDASSWVIAHLVNQAFTAKAVKLPKPEISAAECLTMPASPRHVWKVRLSLYGATTLADIRKKADSIQAQLGAPWLRVREDEEGEVWLYMGDPSSSAKFRRGGENEIANLDFEQAWLDSSVKNRSGRTPQLVKMEPLKTNPDISVLDFSFPPGLDFQRVKSAREQLRANFRAEFVDVAPIGSTGVKMFMAKEDPLPKVAGVPWDDLPSTNIAFGVNALGEHVFFDIEDSPHLLILGSSGSGKSVTMRTILFGALLNGFDVVVIDPTKNGLDFAFAKPWSISPFGKKVYEAASIIRAVYGEVEKRKALNDQYGATKIDELPAEVRPHRIMVMIDEFTSLLGSSPVPPKSDDPEVAAARDEVIAENGARAQVGTMAGKIAREARSVGVHLVLGTQKLTAKTLDSIPGAGDLRTNLARMALGSTTQGDRMSAFRNPMEADDIGEPRKGRGLYEGLNYVKPTVFHSWYAPERDFPAQLEAAGIGKPTEDRIIDPEDRRFKVSPPEPFVEIEAEDDAPTIEDDVVELDLDLGLDDLDLGDLDLDLDGESGGIDSADADEPEGPGDAEPARVVASQMEGESAYEKIDALGGALLDGKEVSALVWDEGGLDEPTEMGATVGELLDELRSDHGIDIEIVGGEPEPEIDEVNPETDPDPEPEAELEIDDAEPEPEIDEPASESTDEPESSLGFEAPPATEVSDSFSFEPELGESEDDDFGFEAPVIIR